MMKWVCSFVVFCLLGTAAEAAGKTPGELQVGDSLRDATLQGLNGSPRKLSEFRGKPLIINMWASWCGPCRAIAPIVDELATQYAGKVKIGKMDVDRNSATPMRYGVRGIPTLLVFKGGQVKEQIVGYVPKEQIQKALEKHIG